MKNITFVLLLIFSLLFCLDALSQKVSIEPYLGMNISRKANNDLVNDYFVNSNYGILGGYQIKENLSVKLGVGFSNRRQEYLHEDTLSLLDSFSFLNSFGIDLTDIESTLNQNGLKLDEYIEIYGIAKLTHLEIPFALSYKLKEFEINAGGYVGFLVNSSKTQRISTSIPSLDLINIDSLDNTGIISNFLPPSYSSEIEELSNTKDLDSFIYGARFGVSYNYGSFVKFYGGYSIDINKYNLSRNNLLTNSKSYFRLGVGYIIKSVKINKDKIKGKF